MKKLLIASLFLVLSFNSYSQKISNNLTGYFFSPDSSNLYSEITFHGNGKAHLSFGNERYDFVQYGDSLILFPDKSLFKFVVKGDSLYGVSYWVKDHVWILNKDSVVENEQTDSSMAKAPLLYRYYTSLKQSDGTFSSVWENLSLPENAIQLMDSLCNAGLGRACLDGVGYRILNNESLLVASLANKHLSEFKPDTTILGLVEKAHKLGEVDAYAVLAAYYELLGNKKENQKYLKMAADEGSIKASMALFSQSMDNEIKTYSTPKSKTKKKAKSRK